MQAITFKEAGGPEVIQIIELPVPTPDRDEVLIKVCTAGINRPDVLQRQGQYNPPPGVTQIPGLEVSGTIIQKSLEYPDFNIGDRVCALVQGGGYAEYVTAKAINTVLLPEGLSLEEGGAMMETFMTVWGHLFQKAGFPQGKSILIHGGASGIGYTATMLAKAWGSTQIFTTVSSESDQKASLALGADIAINYKTHDFVEEIINHTHGEGVDYILDIIGGSYVQRNYKVAAMHGTIVQIGLMQGSVQDLNLFPMLAKRLTHLGATLRSQSPEKKAVIIQGLQTHVWPWIASGKVKPLISKVFPLSQAKDAHEYLETGLHFGKIALMVNKNQP